MPVKKATDAKPRAGRGRADVRKGGRGKTADQLAKEATEHGAIGAQGRTGAGARARMAMRDQAIVAAAREGATPKELASMWKLHERTIRTVLKRSREQRSSLDMVPMELVEEMLRGYRSQATTWASLAEGALESGNYNAAVSAQRGYAEACERLFNRLTEIGKLPENLEMFRMESEIAQLGKLVLDALIDAKKGTESLEGAHHRVMELVAKKQLPVLETTARSVS